MNSFLPSQKIILLFRTRLLVPVLFILAFTFRLHAQAYIERSQLIAGSGNESTNGLVVDAGFSYILGTAISNDYPITLGGTPTGSAMKGILTKLDPTGIIVWSRYLPFNAVATA